MKKNILLTPHGLGAYRKSLRLCFLPVVFGLLTLTGLAHAGIVASSTRLIMTENQQALSVILANTNDYPILVQTWIDEGAPDSTPEKANAPFIPLPAVFRLQPGAVQGLRVINKQDDTLRALPADRESVFWLNLYEIPPKNPQVSKADAHVAMAMNTQMKVFYRPSTLGVAPLWSTVAQQLRFTLIKQGNRYLLRCHNPSPYHASFGQITLVADGQHFPLTQEMDMMTPPLSQRDYPLNAPINASSPALLRIEFVLFDDDGTAIKHSATVSR